MEQFGVARPRGSWSSSHQSEGQGSQGDSSSQGESGMEGWPLQRVVTTYTGDPGAGTDHTWVTSHDHGHPQAARETCNR